MPHMDNPLEPATAPATVKRADLFGAVTDTYQTEGELNGWRATQARLFAIPPAPPPPPDPRQRPLL